MLTGLTFSCWDSKASFLCMFWFAGTWAPRGRRRLSTTSKTNWRTSWPARSLSTDRWGGLFTSPRISAADWQLGSGSAALGDLCSERVFFVLFFQSFSLLPDFPAERGEEPAAPGASGWRQTEAAANPAEGRDAAWDRSSAGAESGGAQQGIPPPQKKLLLEHLHDRKHHYNIIKKHKNGFYSVSFTCKVCFGIKGSEWYTSYVRLLVYVIHQKSKYLE